MESPRLGLEVEDATVDRVVVDDEDRLPGELGGDPGGGPPRRDVRGRGGDREVERGALALDALDPHRAAHQLGEALADGEAEPGAAVLAGGRRVELAELLEQLVRPVGRDADAGVAHRQMDLVRRFAGFDGHHDLADLGELHGVGEQVDHHLTQAGDVAGDAVGHGRVDQECELQTLAGGRFGDEVERRLDTRPQVEGRHFQLEPTGVDLREVEDVVDDPEQRLATRSDDLGELPLARLQVGVEQEAAHPDHGVHRCADLVAHRREERSLGLVRLLRETSLLLELSEKVGVRDGDRRLLGEHLQNATMMRFERPHLETSGVEHAVRGAVDGQRGSDETSHRRVVTARAGSQRKILDEGRLRGSGIRRHGKTAADVVLVGGSVDRDEDDVVAVSPCDRPAVGVA